MKARSGQKKAPEAITNPNCWNLFHGTYITGKSYIDGVDAVAVRMERKWGCDRLRLLVSREMRERFDRQRYKLAAATRNGELVDVQRESERMVVAWSALNKAAEDAGAEPIAPEVWEVALEDGSVAALVQTAAEAHAVVASGRKVTVYTLDEIGRMLLGYTGVLKAKEAWPGAKVTRVDKTIPDPLDGIRQATDFSDPIDDLFEPQNVN